ncbi:MAG: hypothetical protein H0V66_11435, partial [Bdellovibrionales bacterium]|nr:hypothetical protein [Bdellovibrionales bacterium]
YPSDLANVPLDVPLVVSPTGNNRFNIVANSEINITYSGGNHNYCIWNSTRQVISAFLNSKSEARIIFHYDMQAIIAQESGMEGLNLSFPRPSINRSNLLKDLLATAPVQAIYHASYLSYFRNFMAKQYSGMYRTFKLNYKTEGYSETITVQGKGLRDVEVDFTYF